MSNVDLHGNLFLFAHDTAIHVKDESWDDFYNKSASHSKKVKLCFDHDVLTLNIKKRKCKPLYFEGLIWTLQSNFKVA